jgi:transposase
MERKEKPNRRRGRTAYSDEFRRQAVGLVERDPTQLTQIARDLGVHPQSLRTWWRRVQAGGAGPIVPPTRVLTLEEENRRLRQENARLQEERDILKKATAFFARDER